MGGETGVAGYITSWRPSSVPPQAAAGKLASWGAGLGLDPVPEILLHPSVIERFAAHAPGRGRDLIPATSYTSSSAQRSSSWPRVTTTDFTHIAS
jgi:hypothetical protein